MSVLMIAAGLLAGGFLLLVFGLRGRRVDDTPHCRRCRYNLTGLTAQQCPECGTPLDAGAVLWGYRRRRIPLVLCGGAALLFGFAGVSFLLRGVRWVQHYPLPLVTLLARSGAIDAVTELENRYLQGALSEKERADLAELCLDQQVVVPGSPRLLAWIDLLDLLDLSRELTEAQQQRYYAQIIGDLKLDPRPRVRKGEPLLLLLAREGRAPTRSPAVFATETRVAIGESEHSAERLHAVFSNREGISRARTTFHRELTEEPGTYPATYSVTVGLFRAGGYNTEPLCTKSSTLSHTLTIVAADEVEMLRLRRDPAMGQRLSRILSTHSGTPPSSWNWSSMPGQSRRTGIHVAPDQTLPVSVAFKILVRDGDEEREIGYWYGWKESPIGFGEMSVDTEFKAYDPMLVLRTSLDVAQRTVDLHEIWDGEILLGPMLATPPRTSGREVLAPAP